MKLFLREPLRNLKTRFRPAILLPRCMGMLSRLPLSVPAVLIWLPDLVIRGHTFLCSGFISAVAYIATIGVSLLMWLLLVHTLTALRQKHWSGRVLVWVTAPVLPLFTVLLFSYFVRFSLDLPPSALALILRNRAYGINLIGGEGSQPEWIALFLIPVVWIVALELLTRRPEPQPRLPWLARGVASGICAAVVGGALVLPRLPAAADIRSAATVVGGTWQYLFGETGVPMPDRLTVARARPARAPDVVVFMHESVTAFQSHPWGCRRSCTPHVAAFLEKHAGQSVWFHHAVASSSATDVSLPSVFSGLPPYATREQFARAPLLWDYARSLRYRTAFFTAQDYEWANFRAFFFEGSPLDKVASAREFSNAPRVNDSAVDDAVVVRAVTDFIRRGTADSDRPWLIVVQFGSTHSPFYYPGEGEDKDETSAHRYVKSVAYVDRLAQEILSTLAETGRLERTVILSTSDHGENATRPHRPPRGENLDEYAARVPLWIYLPPSLTIGEPDLLAELRANASARVGNIDILPTLLDLWGLFPLQGELAAVELSGRSLFRPVAGDRLLIATETGEIRAWDRTALAVYRGHRKLRSDLTGVFIYDVDVDPEEQHDLSGRISVEERNLLLREVAARPPLMDVVSHLDMEVMKEVDRLIDTWG